jgi:hypothetical protein
MDATLSRASALIAGLFAYLLYLGGQRRERTRGLAARREAVAEQLLDKLHEVDAPVQTQMNSINVDPKALKDAGDIARQVTRIGQLLTGTDLVALPLKLGRELFGWANVALFSPRNSPTAPSGHDGVRLHA